MENSDIKRDKIESVLRTLYMEGLGDLIDLYENQEIPEMKTEWPWKESFAGVFYQGDHSNAEIFDTMVKYLNKEIGSC